MYGIDAIIYKDNDKKIFLLFFLRFLLLFFAVEPSLGCLWVGLFMKK